jgi:hypothetical protein
MAIYTMKKPEEHQTIIVHITDGPHQKKYFFNKKDLEKSEVFNNLLSDTHSENATIALDNSVTPFEMEILKQYLNDHEKKYKNIIEYVKSLIVFDKFGLSNIHEECAILTQLILSTLELKKKHRFIKKSEQTKILYNLLTQQNEITALIEDNLRKNFRPSFIDYMSHNIATPASHISITPDTSVDASNQLLFTNTSIYALNKYLTKKQDLHYLNCVLCKLMNDKKSLIIVRSHNQSRQHSISELKKITQYAHYCKTKHLSFLNQRPTQLALTSYDNPLINYGDRLELHNRTTNDIIETKMLTGSPISMVSPLENNACIITADNALYKINFNNKKTTYIDNAHNMTMFTTTSHGKKIIGASPSLITIWHLKKFRPPVHITPRNKIYSIATTPNNKKLLIGTEETIEIYNLKTAELLTTLNHGPTQSYIKDIIITPNGQKIISLTEHTLYVWDVITCAKEGIFKKFTEQISYA